MLSEFGGNSQDLQAHFFHQNGLDDIQWSQHINSYKYNLKKTDIANQQFDAVVGNPPYGGVGLNKEDLTDSLVSNLVHSEIIPVEVKKELIQVDSQMGGLFKWHQKEQLSDKSLKRLASFPIEVLFVERFINLAKSGGWIAMIIPDGILTNSNLSYVREFIARRCIIEAVVSLPRDTFKAVKTNAKTSIIILKKRKSVENKPKDYPVFIGSTEKIDPTLLTNISKNYNQFYNSNKKNMDNNKNIFTVNDSSGREVVMIRADKTIGDLMSERPASRWDPPYWNPKYDEVMTKISPVYTTKLFSELLTKCNQGDGLRQKKGDAYLSKGIPMINVVNINFTGINTSNLKYIVESHYRRIESAQPKYGDILIVRSGEGSIGKSAIFLNNPPSEKIGITGHINTLGFKDINPFYIELFLKSIFGQTQIDRFENGVSGQTEFTQDSIGCIIIPMIKDDVQKHIETEYLKISDFHYDSMKAKINGDEKLFEKNIDIANNMLKSLILKVEGVIRGEVNDVI